MDTHPPHIQQPAHKKIKHYIFEFFMLFFAVFCGFLAENWREKFVEHEREKQYISSIKEDILSDIGMLDTIIHERMEMDMLMDSLLYFINYDNPRLHGNEIYYFTRRLPRTVRFYSDDRTLSQLKNAGNWRLIQNRNVSERLSTYDNLVRTLTIFIEHREESLILILYQSIDKLFDNRVFEKMISGIGFIRPQNNPQLLSYDKSELNVFCNQVHFRKNANLFFIKLAQKLLAEAKLTVQTIDSEYHLN